MATLLDGREIDDAKLREIVQRAKNIALINGLLCARPESPDIVQHFPFTLFPTVVPRNVMEKAKDLQTAFNSLMFKAGNDHEFLRKCYQRVIEVDDFNRKLWEIYMTVRQDGITQPISLTVFRNDYMMVSKNECLNEEDTKQRISSGDIQFKQIENNTIASGSFGVATSVTAVHRYTLSRVGKSYSEREMPVNEAMLKIAQGLVKAWELYGNESAVILILVDKFEMMKFDHVGLENSCFQLNHAVKCVYKTSDDVIRSGKLTPTKELIVDGEEIAILYFRYGYSPKHYPSEKQWEARLMMERSRAIKCPTIRHHLVGSKKVQQVLAEPGVIEKFLPDEDLANQMRSHFAGQYSIDKGPEGDRTIETALKSPEKFVLKPQREGGGNNLFDDDLKEKLISIRNTDERAAYILMERIHPLGQTNYMVRPSKGTSLDQIASEIGIFGVLVGENEKILENTDAGHVVRSKLIESNEGGLAIGLSCIDSPFLVG